MNNIDWSKEFSYRNYNTSGGIDTSESVIWQFDTNYNFGGYENPEEVIGKDVYLWLYPTTTPNRIDNSKIERTEIQNGDYCVINGFKIGSETNGYVNGVALVKFSSITTTTDTMININGTCTVLDWYSKGIDTSDANAVPMNIEKGKTAYVNGNKITGAINVITEFVETDLDESCIVINTDEENITTISLESMSPGTKRIIKGNSPITLGAPQTEFATAIGLTSDKIVQGETVLGVEGTFEGGSDSSEYFTTELYPGPTNASGIVYSIKKIPNDISIGGESCYYMFYKCNKLTTIPQLDTSNVTNMSSMFKECTALTEIPLLNTINVTNMSSMFCQCKSLTTIPQLDMSSATNTSSMFDECISLSSIPQLDTSSVTDMSSMFRNCSTLTTAPQLDTSSVTNMKSMFYKCYKLNNVPLYNTENVTNMESMFEYCDLTSIPLFNTANVTNMKRMLWGNNELTEIPLFNTSKVTTMEQMCNSCRNLTTIPQFDTSNVTNVNTMLGYCKDSELGIGIQEIPQLDFSKVTNIANFVIDDIYLTTLGGFVNLGKAYTQKTTNYTYYRLNLSKSTLLTHESLMNVINNLYDLNLSYDVANGGTLYIQPLQLGTENLAKLTEEEIAIATSKGWTVS